MRNVDLVPAEMFCHTTLRSELQVIKVDQFLMSSPHPGLQLIKIDKN
jgi:hypothetical protein